MNDKRFHRLLLVGLMLMVVSLLVEMGEMSPSATADASAGSGPKRKQRLTLDKRSERVALRDATSAFDSDGRLLCLVTEREDD